MINNLQTNNFFHSIQLFRQRLNEINEVFIFFLNILINKHQRVLDL